MEPLTVTVSEARRILGVGTTKLYELMNAQRIDSITIGRRRLVVLASIRRLVEAGHAEA